MSPIFEDMSKEERKTYFATHPSAERAVRDVIPTFYNTRTVNPETVDLDDILLLRNQRKSNGELTFESDSGITSLTEGPGEHIARVMGVNFKSYKVPENEVYVTHSTGLFSFHGTIGTYRFKRNEKGLEQAGMIDLHAQG